MKISEILKSKTKHFMGIFICLVTLLFMTFFVRPSNVYIITIYVGVITLLVFASTNLVLKTCLAMVLTTGTALFFFMNYFAGFEIANTLLLLSGIIGITLLVK